MSSLDTKLVLFGIAIINFSGIFYLNNALVNGPSHELLYPKVGMFLGILISLLAAIYTDMGWDADSN
jgi:vacuolar-type H+-ATPase subunit I/STV1